MRDDVADRIHGRPHAITGRPEWFCDLWHPMPCAAGTTCSTGTATKPQNVRLRRSIRKVATQSTKLAPSEHALRRGERRGYGVRDLSEYAGSEQCFYFRDFGKRRKNSNLEKKIKKNENGGKYLKKNTFLIFFHFF